MKKLIAYLLYHANKYPFLCGEHNKAAFYAKKVQLLEKYAEIDGYDVQKIDGKICLSCHGEGVHHRYGWDGMVYQSEACYHCDNGWYKLPKLIVLKRSKFHKYVFHTPIQTYYSQYSLLASPYQSDIRQRIDGYIEHSKGKRNVANIFWLLFLFEPGKAYFLSNIGTSYYGYWFRPYNFLHNVVGLFKSPFVRRCFGEHLKRLFIREKPQPFKSPSYVYDDEDLPF